jgi:hypothetical protein
MSMGSIKKLVGYSVKMGVIRYRIIVHLVERCIPVLQTETYKHLSQQGAKVLE